MSISSQITRLQNAKSDLKTSINAKLDGTAITNETIDNYASFVDQIQTGGGTDMLQSRVDETKSCMYLFYHYSGTNPNCVKNLNTSNVTDMSSMFQGCTSLTSLDLSNFNTSNVTNMYDMFSNCRKLTSLNLSSFNTSNVTNMSYMFSKCHKLTSLNLSSFNTSNVTSMGDMFSNCSALTYLDISNFDFTHVMNYGSMFSGVPANCEILVKDEAAKTWITSKFSNLTNVKVKGAV